MARDLLSTLDVQRAKVPKGRRYIRLFDGGGLCLWVSSSGAKSWQYRYVLDGKEQTGTLGKYSSVQGLAWARGKADEARSKIEAGEHLTVAKRVEKANRRAARAATFAAVKRDWIAAEARRRKWTANYREEVEASLRNHASSLDALPVAACTAPVVAPIVRSLERSKPDMASKLRQRLRGIFDYAVEHGLLPGNPLPAQRRGAKRDRRHHPVILDRAAIGEVLRAADKAEMSRGVKRAHCLVVYTVQRIGEIVPARWDEFDLRAGIWTIPRERMKRKDVERGDHLIPIPPKLLQALQEWRRADGEESEYVCPAPRDASRNITIEAVEKFYRRGLNLADRHSPHSWRSLFSTWARDAGKDADGIEAQLDHIVGNKVASAYDRAHRLELRRDLMAWYEATLLAARDGATVTPIAKGKTGA
jgi:integrase